MEFSARGQQPNTAQPEDHEGHDQPQQLRMPVELCHVVAADVNGEDHDGRKGAGGAEAAQLFDIGYQVAAAVFRRRAAGTQVFQLGKALDDGQRKEQEDEKPPSQWEMWTAVAALPASSRSV